MTTPQFHRVEMVNYRPDDNVLAHTEMPGEHPYEEMFLTPLWPGAWIKWRPNTWGNLVGRLDDENHFVQNRDGPILFSIQRETSRRRKLPRWELHHW